MNLFKQRQPKRFNYTPRHLKDDLEANSRNLETKWRKPTNRKDKTSTLTILLLILGMVIAIWYVLSNYEL